MDALLAALDAARIAVYICVDRGGDLVPLHVNTYSAGRLGLTVEESLAMPWIETVAPHERDRLATLVARVRLNETAPPAVMEIDLLHRDGTPVPSEMTILQVETDQGRAFVCMTRDLRYVTSLEADRMAVVGALAAGIAHEINNPLTYVLLHLRSVRRELGDDAAPGTADAARRIDEAYAGAERIRAITRSVMMFAAAPVAPVDVDVGTIVQSALRLARPELESRARVVVQVFPVARVRAHEPRLGQTVLSMLLFASAGFPGDDPTLNRVVVAVEMRGGDVVFEVTDNGSELTDQDLVRALDPAYVVRKHGDALGFGLGMAKAIAVALGGRLAVAHRPGGGVVTTLALPALPEAAEGDAVGAGAGAVAGKTGAGVGVG
jgi:signal transduction histidine kinase